MSAPLRLMVSVAGQRLSVWRGEAWLRDFNISTAANGVGFAVGSYQTPAGRFRICERIGEGQPIGTIFKGRVAVGQWLPGQAPEEDLILTRILRLEGLDEANANTLERCIYIHGTNREDCIGRATSHGCIRLTNADMIELFELTAVGDLVEVIAG